MVVSDVSRFESCAKAPAVGDLRGSLKPQAITVDPKDIPETTNVENQVT